MEKKEKQEKLTLAELIDQKEKVLARKNQTSELYIKGLGGTVTVQAPAPSLLADVFKMQDGEGDKYLVFHSVTEPCLKDGGVMGPTARRIRWSLWISCLCRAKLP